MAAATPFASGKNFRLIFLLGNSKVVFKDKSWTVTEEAEEVHDDVNGEPRARSQKIINGYDIDVDFYNEDATEINALIADSQNVDARAQPQDASLGILFNPNNGTRSAWQARECTIMNWSINNAGRKDRVMGKVKIRARFFEPLPTV